MARLKDMYIKDFKKSLKEELKIENEMGGVKGGPKKKSRSNFI